MRHAMYFDPHEFEVPESEQHLEIHTGTTRIELEWLMMSLDFDLNPDRMTSNLDLALWQEQARNILETPREPHRMESAFVQEGKITSSTAGDELILVGEGPDQRLLIYWYTTA
jgi:hypothetical protein